MTLEAPSFFPAGPPPDSDDADDADADVVEVDAEVGTTGTEPWEASVSRGLRVEDGSWGAFFWDH